MNEIIEAKQQEITPQANPFTLLQLAIQQGAGIDQLERLMALQERHEANQARKDYEAAFAAFKDEAVKIIKNKSVSAGPLSGKKYAELFAIVNAVTPALSSHGLSSSWKITKDAPDWIEVTCTLKHIGGHSESVSMGGPPDVGGAKNPIQARASAVTYLQRYTLKAITGLSEQDDDTDGGQSESEEHPKLQDGRDAAMDGMSALTAWWGSLTAQDRKELNSEFPALRSAAKQAGA